MRSMLIFLAVEVALIAVSFWHARRQAGSVRHCHVDCPQCGQRAVIDVAMGTLVRCSLIEHRVVECCDRACLKEIPCA
jgi:hypothetical protein